MNVNSLNFSKTALILCDFQNDFLHPKGAYGRNGVTSREIKELPRRLLPLLEVLRNKGVWIFSTHFTLIADKKGEPLVSSHLKSVRPFLSKGDFVSGSWGHDLIDDLKPVDANIEKVSFSAFYMSRLDWILNKTGINTLIFSGIVTNGGVASSVRDAHVRDYTTILLSDGCAAFDKSVHETAIRALKPITNVMTCNSFVHGLRE